MNSKEEPSSMDEQLCVDMQAQPTEITCGPTCLHAIYRFYGDLISLEKVVTEVPMLEGGGTLAVLLGCHALQRGYQASIYTYNLDIFDPTWFVPKTLSNDELSDKLRMQAAAKNKLKLQVATDAYLHFLRLGGKMKFQDLTRALIRQHLKSKRPILTGLSSTFLYQACREIDGTVLQDDVRGEAEGHFVILSGYDPTTKLISVADPFNLNPYSKDLKYSINVDRVICSILLGILTYDANFLIIEPPST